MATRRFLTRLAIAASIWAGPAIALAQTSPPSDLEDVDVVGRPLEDTVASFVDLIGAAPRDRNLARWDHAVCISVVNMERSLAQALVDQVADIAIEIGLDPGGPGCSPDIVIIATSDGDGLARALVERLPRAFRPDIYNSNLGRTALDQFQTSGAPIRWWHVSETIRTDEGPAASRLRDTIREDLQRVIVIADLAMIGSIRLDSLADFIAMVSLAQVDAQADTSGYETVLNLFAADSDRTQRLTQWDLAYLNGLYGARPDAPTDHRQRRDIVLEILRQHESRQNPPAESVEGQPAD